jgi:hypothetical protein
MIASGSASVSSATGLLSARQAPLGSHTLDVQSVFFLHSPDSGVVTGVEQAIENKQNVGSQAANKLRP